MRSLLVGLVASVSLAVSGCRHHPCNCPRPGSGGSGTVAPDRFSDSFCAAHPDVKWVNACLAKAENDTQKGGCCHRLSQAPGTPEERQALRACVAYCAAP